ncbi:MAG TPA: polysaccharide biosynthesis protein [Clostridiales bacterium]|nr:polysaccharide biosynthesis protein [Clostridiales bacterium]
MAKKRKQQSFLHGSIILVGATALVKIIGALFKIPLGNLIGGHGMGYFQKAYDLYLPIYALAMAGLPIAISKIVAEHTANKKFKDVRKTLTVARRAFYFTGFLGMFVMIVLAYPYAWFVRDNQAVLPIFLIAPSLLFCCIMSAYRGYYEGLRNMYPTAVSSIIEALGKLVLGYSFAYALIYKAKSEFLRSGTVFGKAVDIETTLSPQAISQAVTHVAAPYAAAAAILGITIGSFLGAVFLMFRHRIVGDLISREEFAASPEPAGNKETLRLLISIAIPVVMGSLVTNVASLIDVTMVQRQLSTVLNKDPNTLINMYSGYFSKAMDVSDIPNFLYGCYKGFAYSLFNLIPTLTSVLGVSALPVLATAWTEKNKANIKLNIESMLRITALIAIPAGLGLAALAHPILNLLYSNKPAEVQIATPLLAFLGFAAIFAGMMAPMTNMLQAIGRQNIPVRNIAVGALIKIVVNYILVGIPEINILGASIGTLACYAYIGSANLYYLIKYSGVVPNFTSTLIKPAVASVFCAAAAWSGKGLMSRFLPAIAGYSSDKLSTILSMLLAVAVYVLSLILLRAITKEDVLSLPKGEKIAPILERIGIIR